MLLNSWNPALERLADRALAISPADPIALHLKGLALGATGRDAQAVTVFDRAARSEPGFMGAQLALAHTLPNLGHLPEARALLDRIEPLARSGRLLFQLGMLQQRASNGGQRRDCCCKRP